MSSAAEADIIHSATPLEMRLAGVHPRLYADAGSIEAVRERLGAEPWAGFLQRARGVADRRVASGAPEPDVLGDLRGVGCGLAHLAVVYQLTREPIYFDAACDHLRNMTAREDWTTSLMYGHWAHGVALAYDWLYHELDPALRQRVGDVLYDRTRRIFEQWGDHAIATATGYIWNHMSVVHAGMVAAGCALWGEVDRVAPILRMALEKARIMVDALGPDGASPEGLAYGQYYNDTLLKVMVLCDELLGLDLFEDCAFYRSYPRFMLHSTLPPCAWSKGEVFVQLGDALGHHWYGPDMHLRLIARRYRDGHAQWLADETARHGVSADSSSYLNLFWHDPSVTATAPDDLPTLHHLDDKDIVFMRSGWDSRASVFAIKCGPSAGYHASRRYRHDVSGGHMHPDAGHVVLHAGGEWLLIDDGYCFKQTAYQNTLLVDGVGQTGEGAVWFEDLEIRRGRPEGRIVAAQSGADIDWAIADAAPAYEPEAKLRRFLRHVLYLKPDVWVLVDELVCDAEATFELRFHAPAPFEAIDADTWSMRCGPSALRLSALGPTPVAGRAVAELMRSANPHKRDQSVDTLVLANAAPSREAVFVTVLHAPDAGADGQISADTAPIARLEGDPPDLQLHLQGPGGPRTLGLRLARPVSATPIFECDSA